MARSKRGPNIFLGLMKNNLQPQSRWLMVKILHADLQAMFVNKLPTEPKKSAIQSFNKLSTEQRRYLGLQQKYQTEHIPRSSLNAS